MKTYKLSHLSDKTLLCNLSALILRDRATTADVLAHLAEVETRRLYLAAGYPSMLAYCVEELRLSEDSALKRIRAARAAQEFPAIFAAVAEGRLNLNAVILLKAHLTQGNVDELLAACALKTRSAIEQLLADRFPRSEALPMVVALGSNPQQFANAQVAARPLEGGRSSEEGSMSDELATRPVRPPKLAPIAAERFALQVTMGKSAHDKLCHAQALLSHRIPTGDLGEVLERVLDLAIAQLEKQKFAATDRPHRVQDASTNPRTIPAHVRRAVRQRDGDRCTFVSADGHRCGEHKFLEFDHIDPVARGGQATVGGIRLLCRAHNQYAAEHVFGAEFVRRKREAAWAAEVARAAEAQRAASAARAAAQEKASEVIPWLRRLGIRADEARLAAERCEHIPDASIEERVRVALSCFGPRGTTRFAPAAVASGP